LKAIEKSFQFFGKDGLALHKIYLTNNSNESEFDALTEKYKSAEQSSEVVTEPIVAKAVEKADSEIDVAGFQQAWKDLGYTRFLYADQKIRG
jgi:putative hemin transport protein